MQAESTCSNMGICTRLIKTVLMYPREWVLNPPMDIFTNCEANTCTKHLASTRHGWGSFRRCGSRIPMIGSENRPPPRRGAAGETDHSVLANGFGRCNCGPNTDLSAYTQGSGLRKLSRVTENLGSIPERGPERWPPLLWKAAGAKIAHSLPRGGSDKR